MYWSVAAGDHLKVSRSDVFCNCSGTQFLCKHLSFDALLILTIFFFPIWLRDTNTNWYIWYKLKVRENSSYSIDLGLEHLVVYSLEGGTNVFESSEICSVTWQLFFKSLGLKMFLGIISGYSEQFFLFEAQWSARILLYGLQFGI